MANLTNNSDTWSSSVTQTSPSSTYVFHTADAYNDKDIALTVRMSKEALNLNPSDIHPIKSHTFTHAITANDTNNGRIIFANVDLTDKSNYYTPWQVHYLLEVTSATNSLKGYYDVKMGASGSTPTYYIQNNFYNGSYPVYYHNLYYPKAGYTSEGAMLGVRIQSATSATASRTYTIHVLEERNCTINFRDTIGTYGALYTSTKWTYAEYNATSVGLQETGDADTVTTHQNSNYRVTIDSEIPLGHGCLFGYTADDKVVPISAYTATYASYTTSINKDRVYPTHGIDWRKGLYAAYSWTYRAKNTTATESVRTDLSGLDLRHTDNCVASANATTLGMVDLKRVYIRGVIKEDGLFYLAPLSVTYNNVTYKRVWTQDIPTSPTSDPNGYPYYYWYIGMPYYNTSNSGSLYQINFEEVNPMYGFVGSVFGPVCGRSLSANTVTGVVPIANGGTGATTAAGARTNLGLATVASSGSYNDLSNKPTIPSAVTESTVSGWGFTKNSGTYSKPSGGIPKTDLASAVQTSLGKADTALQSYTESDPVFSASPAAGITNLHISTWNAKGTYSKPTDGIPKSDLASAVQTSLGKADTALQSYTEQYTGTVKKVNGISPDAQGNVTIPTGGGSGISEDTAAEIAADVAFAITGGLKIGYQRNVSVTFTNGTANHNVNLSQQYGFTNVVGAVVNGFGNTYRLTGNITSATITNARLQIYCLSNTSLNGAQNVSVIWFGI